MARHRSVELTPAEQHACEGKLLGRTRAEIAAELGITPQAVKKLWYRARKRLAENQRADYLHALNRPKMKRIRIRPFSLGMCHNV